MNLNEDDESQYETIVIAKSGRDDHKDIQTVLDTICSDCGNKVLLTKGTHW